MRDDLQYIFDNINNWLKFAEAKSATLLTLNGAIIFGVSTILSNFKIPDLIMVYFICTLIFSLLSLIVCLISFIPSLKLPWLFKPRKTDKNTNLYFFSDIATYDAITYLATLSKDSSVEYNVNNLDIQLATQIISNSTIALKKYTFFKISIWFTVSAVITPIFALFLLPLTKD